jgi:CheY-like chemotaxis protein/HPt (histidine-containing phosphotransfer) domain-containing protein
VEDNDINREVAKDLLARTGASIELVTNGKEAVAIANRERFDCVLMDIQMPVMDGEEATRALRSYPALRKLPIIATTANAMAGDRDRFINAGMNDYVAKPIQASELYATLSRWITADVTEIDTVQGLARVNGNFTLYLRLLRKLRENHTDVVQRIRSALRSGDRRTARREAHTIICVAGSLGAASLSDAARAVEVACRSDVPLAAIDVTAMENALQRMLEHIDQTLLQQEPVSTTGAPDRSQIAVLLGQLKQAIDDHDATAGETFNRLQLILGDDARITALGQHIGRYDFPAARAALDTLVRDSKEELLGVT